MWWWNDYDWHMPWTFGPFVMLFFMALCVGMMFVMMRGHHGGRSDYPLDILKERFARGEITQAEYEERRRVLEA
jgi:putative membrane protein